jgi:hypothetical protein
MFEKLETKNKKLITLHDKGKKLSGSVSTIFFTNNEFGIYLTVKPIHSGTSEALKYETI